MNIENKNDFHYSLDLTNDELEIYIPDLLKGLWELGSMPEYVVELIRRNNIGVGKNVIDLGCGKGAVVVTLAQQFEIKGLGIDIVPHFIEEANNYAKKYGVSEKVVFETNDIIEIVKTIPKQDIVIYGYDSEVLGDLKHTVGELSKCMKDDGYIILEFMYANLPNEGKVTESEMMNILKQTDCRISDRIDWDKETLIQTNRKNTEIIQENVKNLISQYPEKHDIFNEYIQNQIIECNEIENDYTCTTLLLVRQNQIS